MELPESRAPPLVPQVANLHDNGSSSPQVENAVNDDLDDFEDDDLEEDDVQFDPPTLQQVVRRAWALSCVIYRAFLEKFDDLGEAAVGQSNILTWIDDLNLQDEFEPFEWELIQADIGEVSEQDIINGTWRTEGLVVLAWALGRFEVPRHDEMAHPREVVDSLLFLEENAPEEAEQWQLRSEDELERFAELQLALHWRMRDFSIRPEAMNFREFPKTAWFGNIDLSPIPMAGDDLEVDGVPIAEAPGEMIQLCSSIAQERHQAINWLQGYGEVYSEVDTST